MNTTLFVPIVEGQGEVGAVPKLLYRICAEKAPFIIPRVNEPIRVKANQFIQNGDVFAKYYGLAAAKARMHQPSGRVLIFLDSEDYCPAQLGPRLMQQAVSLNAGVRCDVILAYREYETWFIASARSLGLPENQEIPEDPCLNRGAKEWLSRNLQIQYSEVRHQAEFTQRMDLDSALVVPSFARLVRKIAG